MKSYLQTGADHHHLLQDRRRPGGRQDQDQVQDVEVGKVNHIAIAKNLANVVVTAELKKETKPYLVEDTKFWVVRPRISGRVGHRPRDPDGWLIHRD